MAAIRLYADSACDLDRSFLKEMGVGIFCLTTTINEQTYRDRLDIEPPEFYRMIARPGVLPITSQANVAEFEEEFRRVIAESDDDIIYIAFSSGLSGTYQSACIARDSIDSGRITVIDSLSASVGYGLTVIRAAKAIAAGMSKDEVIAEITDNMSRMQHIFIVGSFEMLKRGGRVSATAAAIGNLLNIKMICHFVDGKIVPLEKVHGLKKAKKRLLELMAERGSDLRNQTIGISYSYDLEGALEIKRLIEEEFGCRDFVVSEVGAVIGSHVGAGTYSVFFLT
ncbi:MAG: DegV family protein [Syntrophomonadaceae bacterium]|nr:DegV family protein [Syntrophomonadaceae bacterium]